MQLSPLYLEKIQAAERVGEERGEARLIVRLLTRLFGSIEVDITVQIQQLGITQLDDLGDALLDFTSLADLVEWLMRN